MFSLTHSIKRVHSLMLTLLSAQSSELLPLMSTYKGDENLDWLEVRLVFYDCTHCDGIVCLTDGLWMLFDGRRMRESFKEDESKLLSHVLGYGGDVVQWFHWPRNALVMLERVTSLHQASCICPALADCGVWGS